ncbi:unnamed protein product, partial [Meganyctiphanes norvegica]
KISDFGLARDIYKDNQYLTPSNSKNPKPWKWTALESLQYGLYTSHSDVWAFGVLMWEIFTLGGVPYPEYDGHVAGDVKEFIDQLNVGLRLDKPTHATDQLYTIMKSCWAYVPQDRVTFVTLQDQLAALMKEADNQFLVELDQQLSQDITEYLSPQGDSEELKYLKPVFYSDEGYEHAAETNNKNSKNIENAYEMEYTTRLYEKPKEGNKKNKF